MKVRITVLLMTAIGGLVALAVGTVLIVSATANFKNTFELLQQQAEETVGSLEAGVGDYVEPARSLVAHIRRLVGEGKLLVQDTAQLTTALQASLAAAPQVAGVVFWRPDGSGLWITRGEHGAINTETAEFPPPAGFVEFIAEMGRHSRIDWGEPLYHEGLSVMTISGALYQNSRFVGVIGAGLSLIDMSGILRNVGTGVSMQGFVLYGDDKVLAHPALLNPSVRERAGPENPLLDLDQIDDPLLENFSGLEVEELPADAQFEMRNFGDGDIERLVLSRTTDVYGEVPWRIGVQFLASDFAQQIERLFGSIAVGVGLLALSVVLAILLARRIARPIRLISTAAGQIAEHKFNAIPPLPTSRIRELDEQSRAFNRMLMGLKWLETYVPKALVERLMTAGSEEVGHREAELTVMFADIVGFTPLSEAMPPVEIAKFLNRHFDAVNRCIEAEGGTLDKYIGDAAMAFWGAPEAFTDHAARACRAALALHKEAEAYREAGLSPPLRIKVAIHTGPLIVGNIGAEARMNYTVIGDTVNVASRIEQLCSAEDDGSPSIIIVSGETVRAAGPGFKFEPLGAHTVKGRHSAIDVWRLTPGSEDSRDG